MFPSENRSVTSNKGFKSLNCFSTGNNSLPAPGTFGSLVALTDEVLAASHSITHTAPEDGYLLLLPLIGVVCFAEKDGKSYELMAGYAQCFAQKRGDVFTITNPLPGEMVRYIQIRVQASSSCNEEKGLLNLPTDIKLEENTNQLILLSAHFPFVAAVGKYGGRKQGGYCMQQKGNGVFAFVIDGSLEIEDRLLQTGDGMGLWPSSQVEFESLTASSLLLIVEVPAFDVNNSKMLSG